MGEHVAVSCHRQQRPTVAVHVVLEVEDFRKARAGGLVLSPGAVRVLRVNQILDAAPDARAMRIVERAEAHDGPGGLRCSAGSLAFEDWVVVWIAARAPTAILVLDAFQPIPGFGQPRLAHVQIEGAQAPQNLPGAIDVIHAPAAIPRAIFLLVLADEAERLLDLRIDRKSTRLDSSHL